jgi:hypothetical protein
LKEYFFATLFISPAEGTIFFARYPGHPCLAAHALLRSA